MCGADGAEKEVRRPTFTERQYSPGRHTSDCAPCTDEETEAQRSEMPLLGLRSEWKKPTFKLGSGRLWSLHSCRKASGLRIITPIGE